MKKIKEILAIGCLLVGSGLAFAEPISLDLAEMDMVTACGVDRGSIDRPPTHEQSNNHRQNDLHRSQDKPHNPPSDQHHSGAHPLVAIPSSVSIAQVNATASATGPGSLVEILSIEKITSSGIYIFTQVLAMGGQSATATLQQFASMTISSRSFSR